MFANSNRTGIYIWSYIFFILFLVFSGVSISISQISLALSLIIFVFGVLRGDADIHYYRTGLEKYIAIFVGTSFILTFLSPSVLKNILYIKDFWLISVFVLTTSLIQDRDDAVRIVNLMVFIVLFNSLFGILQHITNIDLINAMRLGLDHKKSQMSFENRYIFGFLGHHLTYGGYIMSLAVPLVFISFVSRKELKGMSRFLIRLSSLVSLVAIILSWARSVIFSLPVSILPAIFKRKRLIFITGVVIVIGIIAASTFFLNSDVMKNSVYDQSSRMRVVIWRTAFKVWLRHPIFGSGGGNYIEEFKEEFNKITEEPDQVALARSSKHYKWNIQILQKSGTHPHNDYLNQLVRKGIVGFLAFIFMIYGLIRYMVDNLKHVEDRFLRLLYLGLFGSFCCFLAASMFQCYYTDEENLAMFWFVIGFLVAVVKIEKRDV